MDDVDLSDDDSNSSDDKNDYENYMDDDEFVGKSELQSLLEENRENIIKENEERMKEMESRLKSLIKDGGVEGVTSNDGGSRHRPSRVDVIYSVENGEGNV